MESTPRKRLMLIALLFAVARAEQSRNNSSMGALDNNAASLELPEGNNGGGVYGGGGCGWGWGGPGGSSGGGGGGGGAGYWKCECRKQAVKRGKQHNVKIDFRSDKYKIGEFAECRARGRCKGMKLDCPLHCGGPCLYDCTHTCRPYCKR